MYRMNTTKNILKKVIPNALRRSIRERINATERRIKKFVIRRLRFPVYLSIKMAKQRTSFFENKEKEGLRNIPVFLISFNRLTYLKACIERLEQLGVQNIIIIDNSSTNVPLLQYYETISYQVIRLDKNYGHQVFWNNPYFEKYRKDFYIVSDPDVIPLEECPADFIEKMFFALKKYPNVRKVGFSLKIDDIPEDNVFGESIFEWEKANYEHYLEKDNIYIANIDTTFALYLPDQFSKRIDFLSAYRVGYPYQARHLPWYKRNDTITEEDKQYSTTSITGWWNLINGKQSQN